MPKQFYTFEQYVQESTDLNVDFSTIAPQFFHNGFNLGETWFNDWCQKNACSVVPYEHDERFSKVYSEDGQWVAAYDHGIGKIFTNQTLQQLHESVEIDPSELVPEGKGFVVLVKTSDGKEHKTKETDKATAEKMMKTLKRMTSKDLVGAEVVPVDEASEIEEAWDLIQSLLEEANPEDKIEKESKGETKKKILKELEAASKELAEGNLENLDVILSNLVTIQESIVTESELLFIPSSRQDAQKAKKIIDKSDFHADYDSREQYFSFEEEDPDALEMELQKMFDKGGVDGHFELQESTQITEVRGSRSKGSTPVGFQLMDDFLSSFRFGKGTYSDKDYYDYSNGYVYTTRTIKSENSPFLSPVLQKKLDAAKMGQRRGAFRIQADLKVSRPISDAEPKPVTLRIGAMGKNYYNFMEQIEIPHDKKKFNFNTFFNKYKSTLKKVKQLPDDILEELLWDWEPLSKSEKDAGSKSWGLGSGASTTTYTDFDKIYTIKGLDKIFGSKEKLEQMVRESFAFGKSRSTKNLQFNWKKGIMTTGGTYSMKWD